MRRALPLAIAAFLVLAAPAAALDRYVPMKAPPGPGPAKYDRVFVKQIGPKRARTVLVLVPGTNGGAGGVVPVAREIVRRVRRTQVWIVDRREQALEDTSVFRTGDPQRAQDYYLGFRYTRVAGENAKFAAEWGLRLQLADLRTVVRRAARGGRRVVLGGHSAGASTAVAYAAWDFGGRPGFRDIDGLVLIDGGLLGSFASADLARAKRELAEIRGGSVFLDVLGLGLPEINGIFTEVGALWAHTRPDEPSVLQQYPLLPDSVKPPIRVTNEAFLGYAFDETTSPGLSQHHPPPRRPPGGQRRPEGLAGRRAHADRAAREGVGGGVAQRDRVVLPAPASARHRRRQPAAPDAGGPLPRAATEARPANRRAAVRLLHRSHGGSRGARRTEAGGDLAGADEPDRRRPRGRPPGSAVRRAEDEPLPEDGRAVPAAPPALTLASPKRWAYDRSIGSGTRLALAAIATAAVWLLAAPAASANSTLLASPSGGGLFVVNFTAATGKVNDVQVAVGANSITFTDPGDLIDEAVAECNGGGTNTVACNFPAAISSVSTTTDDLDDSIRVDAPVGMPGAQGSPGQLVLSGGDGGDEISVSAPPGVPGTVAMDGDDGDAAGDGGDILAGSGMRDLASGDGGVDVLFGGAGDDSLAPGPGNAERADAGPGDDFISYTAGDGTDELLDGGAGVDTLFLQGPSSMLSPGFPALAVDLAVGTLNQTAGGSGSALVPNFEFLIGSGSVITVAGTDGHNTLSTGASADVIDPRGGPDRVTAGSGADRILARDGFADRIECGLGEDTVEADQFDELFDCEAVDVAQVLPAGVELDAPVCTVTGVRRVLRRARFLRGLRPEVGCNEPASLEARLTVLVRRRGTQLVTVKAGQLVLAEQARPLAAGERRLSLKVPRRLRRALGRRFAATLTVVARDQFGNRGVVTRVVRVRR